MAVALAECCVSNGDAMAGAEIDLNRFGGRLDALLFGETQSRVLISAAHEDAARISSEANRSGVSVTTLGRTGGSTLNIKTHRGELSWEVGRLRDVWWNAIGRLMES